ncbi:putative SH3 domain protein [Rhizoctonia solani 123E]|uniref:Putative SH3 domain protein n=1 Tax=Rhizoctonia solani 123E TaxID=1423351 RepID=A0A074REX4_9AGAM|nr:putative SH3 domain protein [Rhizoctonia solani 123E]
MVNDNEVTINKIPLDTANSLLLQPQPTSPFPSPSSSFVPPPAQEAHEFANKSTTRIAVAKQPRSAVDSRRNSNERISFSPVDLNPQPLPPPTPSLKRFSADSNNSLSSSRPAPASPALSRHSSLIHTGLAKRLSTLSIVSTSTPPPTAGFARPRPSIRIKDFAFAPTDERHFGRGLQNRTSIASSIGSDLFSGSRGSSEPNSPLEYPDPSSGDGSDEDETLFIPGIYRALYPFEPEGTAEMALVEDQRVNVLGRGGGVGWVVVLKPDGEQALVPEGYLELVRPDLDDDDDDDSVGATEAPQTPKALS